ncbi:MULTISPECIES: hypothetical protein [Vibrio]|jgi:hypothetical protein|uniref:Uncharacterized protein n=1 Tax=Vibrio jasicida TaxID=766224 RepID=A0AAU9QHQ5_9VIBR|nr:MULTISPECIES: hypothetical protein [Vibrio]KIP77550.1 hypothetical protein SN10_02510 [Vibrio harveyi]AQW59786.1 hypothetical protein A9237_17175 [Vibrio owensii]CAH1524092.1 conserved hypothetical protein [Vibrio jasicida]CAH1567565.1 conserved hypothetical protein [Vibrio jasicida]CAH1578419.1 conserved hypothetical protein [Vibrio jasicida]
MFGNWKRNRQIREVAKDITPKLALKYGEKADYSKEEIDWALKENGKTDDAFALIAYGMLISQAAYVPMGLSQELGEHAEFQSEVSLALFDQATDLVSVSALLTYAEIQDSHKQQPATDSDDFDADGGDFGGDGGGDGGGE